jgi:hypothetical protein
MRKSNLDQLDLSFLPPKLKREVKNNLKKALEGLEKIRWPIKAVVLAGGYKNKEITLAGQELKSDIDLFVFSNFIPFFWKKLLIIQKELNKPGHLFHYRGVIPCLLYKSKTFWAYRLKQEGIVLRGKKNILQRIQARENNISPIEALRILFRTLIFQGDTLYNIFKTYMNIGESYLAFAGKLAPSYKERLAKIGEVAKELNLSPDLTENIKAGYRYKLNEILPEKAGEYNLSFSGAKKDCLQVIDHLLLSHLKVNLPLDEKLDILAEQIKPRHIFNFVFFWFLKDLKEIKPKFFPIVLRFKITDLWKITIYSQRGERKKLFGVLEKYFKVKKFSDKTLIKIFEAHPSFSTIEI